MSESILQEAQRIIHGERNIAYGHPRDNFAAIAAQWNAYLDHMGDRQLNSLDVANLMILMKVARVINGVYHRDSYTDMAGYAGTGERLQEPVEETPARRDIDFSIKINNPTIGEWDAAFGDSQKAAEAIARAFDIQFNDTVIEPGQWKSLDEVPHDVTVVDQGGHYWEFIGNSWLWSSRGGPINGKLFQVYPFTQVEGPPPSKGTHE